MSRVRSLFSLSGWYLLVYLFVYVSTVSLKFLVKQRLCMEKQKSVGLNLELLIIPFSAQAILFLIYWNIFIHASTFQTYEVQISCQTCSLVSFTFKPPLSKDIKKSTVLIFQFAFPSIQEFTSLCLHRLLCLLSRAEPKLNSYKKGEIKRELYDNYGFEHIIKVKKESKNHFQKALKVLIIFLE